MKRSPPERFRLALRLLREYERAEREPTLAEREAWAKRMEEWLASDRFGRDERPASVNKWREAVTSKGTSQ